MIRTVGDLRQVIEGMSDADTIAIEIELPIEGRTVYEIGSGRLEPCGPRLRLQAATDDRWDV